VIGKIRITSTPGFTFDPTLGDGMSKRYLMSLSGGADSATALAFLLGGKVKGTPGAIPPEQVECVLFRYGSKHNPYEQKAAYKVAEHYGVQYHVVDLSSAFELQAEASTLLRGGDVPSGHYEEETMRKTVVPGRNLIFAAVLASVAEAHKFDQVVLGVHAGDHFIYPDCRPAFVAALFDTVKESTEGKVGVIAPLMNHTKKDIIQVGLELGVPYHLTRTCYSGWVPACGRCGACQERLEAFELNGAVDPIAYVTRDLIPKA
jgi:7-cyano-7-deazaguanine synthase